MSFLCTTQGKVIISERKDISRIVGFKKGYRNKTLLEVVFDNGDSGTVGLTEIYSTCKELVTDYVLKNNLQGSKGFWMVKKRLRQSSKTDEGLINVLNRKVKRRKQGIKDVLVGKMVSNINALDNTQDVSKDWVQLQWECARRKISTSDHYYGSKIREPSTSVENGKMKESVIADLKEKVRKSKHQGGRTDYCSLSYEEFESMSERDRYAFIVALETEQRFKAIDLSTCSNCLACNTNAKNLQKNGTEYLCDACTKNKEKYGIDNYVIPYWIREDGVKHTSIPEELQGLSFAEKQLIALATSHMNLIHMKNGTLGSTGHVVALEQDISNVATILPRLPKDLTIVKVLRKGQTKSQEVFEKMFTVRKREVLAALHWLVKHNELYKKYSVKVDEKNLYWMGEKNSAVLPVLGKLYEDLDNKHEVVEDDDIGPAPTQTLVDMLHEENCDYDVAGSFCNTDNFIPSEKDKKILASIKNSKYGKKKGAVINWPEFSDKAISEYGEKKIFCMLFPWLYPGGNGDYMEERDFKLSPKEWSQIQLFLKDGRFTKDKLWCFYTLNYRERRRNMDQGHWFVNYFLKENINNIEELQNKISLNESKFIPKLQYFSRMVAGSDAYWREKRGELVSWMSHHIYSGNGAPSFFITLSCAEYHWKDIEKLVKKRHAIANEMELDLSKLSHRIDAMNDYAIVVQEYFQRRTQEFLDFYCKKVFGINHYFVRYEFAKSRGQIHAHLIALLGKESSIKDFNSLAFKFNYDRKKQAQVLDNWMTEVLNLTATHPASFENGELHVEKVVPPEGTEKPFPMKHPSSYYCSEITSVKEDYISLCNYCQMHNCSGYCLNYVKKKKTTKTDTQIAMGQKIDTSKKKAHRECRFNAGIEHTPGKGDTPGFTLQENASVASVGHGFTSRKEFRCKRNTRRLNQTSLYLAQIWRGNVDIKPLLYNSNPLYPDYEDIVGVTDYVIGYQMKGQETLKVERKNLISFIMNSDDQTGNKDGLYTLARKWMNRASVSRIISRQEANCLLASLNLTLCTEHMENISLSYRVTNETMKKNTNSWTTRYSKDNPTLQYSFHQYVYQKLNEKKKRKQEIIPHYTGALQYCPIPLTENYCYNALMVYKPWNEHFPITKNYKKTFRDQFLDLIKSSSCPTCLLITYERALRKRGMERQGLLSYEPTTGANTYHEDFEDTAHLSKETADILDSMRSHKVDIQNEEENFERGYNYDWSSKSIERPKSVWRKAITFMSSLDSKEDELNIPKFLHNKILVPYDIKYTSAKQKQTLLKVFDTLRKWVTWKQTGKNCGYKPLRLTISGAGGTGKSFIIQCIVSHIRQMTKDNDSVHVLAPTGNAAFNIQGLTIHNFAGLTPMSMNNQMSTVTEEKLRRILQTTVALLIDERSMIDSKLLGLLESRVAATAHECCHSNESWGGIPIVILLGDDYQLPPQEPGAFYIPKSYISSKNNLITTKNGMSLFMDLSQEVIFLDEVIRQDEGQIYFRKMLQRIRKGWCTPEDEKRLRSLILNTTNFSTKDIQMIKQEALYLFANKEPKNIFNKEKLMEMSGKQNPVAVCRSKDTTTKKGCPKTAHLNSSYDLKTTYLCRGATVELYKTNLKPKYGLFNGAMGKIVDIIFEDGESPNEGFLPKMVIVDFPQYNGPPWDRTHPTHVPIYPIERRCKGNCCTRIQIPLSVSWAKTIHTFQGQTVGFPTDTKGPFAVRRIIVDVGERTMEGVNPGLFYVTLSRPTTIGYAGSEDCISGKSSVNSAYFFKPGRFPEQVQNLTISVKNAKNLSYQTTPDSLKYKKVQARDIWVKYLKEHEWKGSYNEEDEEAILKWINATALYRDKLLSLVRNVPVSTREKPQENIEEQKFTTNCILLKKTTEQNLYRNIADTNVPIFQSNIDEFFNLLSRDKILNISFTTNFSTRLQRYGKTYWDMLQQKKIQNKKIKTFLQKNGTTLYIPWLSKNTKTEEVSHNTWTLLIRNKKNGKVTFKYYTPLLQKKVIQSLQRDLQRIKLFERETDTWSTIKTPEHPSTESAPFICFVAALYSTTLSTTFNGMSNDTLPHITRNYMKTCLEQKKILSITFS